MVYSPANRVLVLSVWLHYGSSNTLSQIVEVFNVEVFNFYLQLKIMSGGLMQMPCIPRGSSLPGPIYIFPRSCKAVQPTTPV